MADQNDKSPDVALGDLRDVTLCIPGEHFFCETLSLPDNLIRRSYRDNKDPAAMPWSLVNMWKSYSMILSFHPIHLSSWRGGIILPEDRQNFNFLHPLSNLKTSWENLNFFEEFFHPS